MRTIITYLIGQVCLLFCLNAPFAIGQTILLEEDFNDCTYPADWSVNVIGDGPATWYVGTPLNSNSDGTTIDGSCMLIMDDDAAGENTPPYILELQTPMFELSGFSTIELTMDVHFRDFEDQSSLSILAFDGSEYHEIATYREQNYSGQQFSEFVTLNADLSFFAKDQLSLVIRYDDEGTWAWWAGVDNIKVIGKGSADNIVLENFNSCQLPDGWTAETLLGDAPWQFGFIENGNAFPNSMNGSCFAYFDDDGIGQDAPFSTVRLYSPVFDGTQYASYFLDYDLIFRKYAELENFAVYVSDGNSLKLVKSYFEEFGGEQFDDYAHEQLDLSEYRAANMQLVFQYEDGNAWGWWLGMDNVKISGEGQLNDRCANAIDLTVDAPTCLSANNRTALFFGATTTCGIGADVGGLWYRFEIANAGLTEIYTESGFNDVLSLFAGDCGSMTQIQCHNRDEYGFEGESLIQWLEQGTYFLRVSGQEGEFRLARGTFCVGLHQLGVSQPVLPLNDLCNAAQPLIIGADCMPGNNENANFEGPSPMRNNRSRADVWYYIDVENEADLEIRTNANFADVIAVYEGGCGSFTEVISNEYGQVLEFRAMANQRYYIQISGVFATIEGQVCMAVRELSTPAALNDLCVNAQPLNVDGACVFATNIGSTFSGPSPSCEIFPQSDVWFSFTTPPSGGIRLNTGADFIHTLSLYSGTCSNLEEVACFNNPEYCDGYIDINNLEAGTTYFLQVTSAHNDFGYLQGNLCMHLLDINTLAQSALSLSVQVVCIGEGQGKLDINVTGGIGPYQFEGNTAADFFETGDPFFVLVSDDTGCERSVIGTVECGNLPCALEAIIEKTDITCYNEQDGTAAAIVGNGTPPFRYLWSNGQESENLNGLAAGSYQLSIQDANNCLAEFSVTIAAPDLLQANSSATCETLSGANDGTALADPIGGTPPFTYLWSNGETNPSLGNLAPDIYTLTLTDANGCTSIESVSVCSASCAFYIEVDKSNVSCHGDANGSAAINLFSGTDPYTYEWSNGATGNEITDLDIGTYTVTVTDGSGCFAVANIAITEPLELESQAEEIIPVSCNGLTDGYATFITTGGTAPYQYSWPDGITGPSHADLAPGIYAVTTTDINGCSLVRNILITEPEELSIGDPQIIMPLCPEESNGRISVSPDGGTLPYSYMWDNGQNLATAQGLSAGSYALTVTDANGCATNMTIDIEDPEAPGLLIDNISPTTANEATGFIEISFLNPFGDYEFEWYLGNDLISTTEDIYDLSAGDYTLLVYYNNASCFSTYSFTIDNTVGTIHASAEVQILVLPNPSKGQFRLLIELNQAEMVQCQLLDISGKLLVEKGADLVKARQFDFDLSEYPAGVYPLRIVIGEERFVRRLVLMPH